jgi:hypothetical protein
MSELDDLYSVILRGLLAGGESGRLPFAGAETGFKLAQNLYRSQDVEGLDKWVASPLFDYIQRINAQIEQERLQKKLLTPRVIIPSKEEEDPVIDLDLEALEALAKGV